MLGPLKKKKKKGLAGAFPQRINKLLNKGSIKSSLFICLCIRSHWTGFDAMSLSQFGVTCCQNPARQTDTSQWQTQPSPAQVSAKGRHNDVAAEWGNGRSKEVYCAQSQTKRWWLIMPMAGYDNESLFLQHGHHCLTILRCHGAKDQMTLMYSSESVALSNTSASGIFSLFC